MLCFVSVACRGLFSRVAPFVSVPPAPIVLEDVGNPIAHLPREEGIAESGASERRLC